MPLKNYLRGADIATWLKSTPTCVSLCLTQQPIRLPCVCLSYLTPCSFHCHRKSRVDKVFMSQQPWCRKCKTTWNVQETSWGLAAELQSFQLADLLSILLTNSLHLSQNSKLYCHNQQDYTAQIISKAVYTWTQTWDIDIEITLHVHVYEYFTLCLCFFPFIIIISSYEV